MEAGIEGPDFHQFIGVAGLAGQDGLAINPNSEFHGFLVGFVEDHRPGAFEFDPQRIVSIFGIHCTSNDTIKPTARQAIEPKRRAVGQFPLPARRGGSASSRLIRSGVPAARGGCHAARRLQKPDGRHSKKIPYDLSSKTRGGAFITPAN
jgi:hypothetical protein